MKILRQLFLVALAGVCSLPVPLSPELLIVKKTAEGFGPLDDSDVVNSTIIANILLKYQWPMCIAAELTEEEQNELLSSGQPCAEEFSIQKKIREHLKDNSYYVVFIPTTIYELFCMAQVFDVKDRLNPFQAQAEDTIGEFERDEKHWSDLRKILNKDEIAPVIRKQMFDIYKEINKTFFDGREKNASFYINNALAAELFSKYPLLKNSVNDLDFSLTIQSHANEFAQYLTDRILRAHKPFNRNPIYWRIGRGAFSLMNEEMGRLIASLKTEHQTNILAKIIALEYEARKQNKALLLRGTSLEEFQISLGKDPKKAALLGSTLMKQESEFDEHTYERHDIPFETAYLEKKNEPYSISFGNSPFAGAMRDTTACAYYFLGGSRVYSGAKDLPHTAGYALLIDKKSYIQDQCGNLFFIPPLAPIAALFQHSELFHPRTKAAVSLKEKDKVISVRGLFGWYIKDPTGAIVITRDPLRHAALFSEFLAANAQIISRGALTAEEKKHMKEAHIKAAKFYKAAKKVLRALQKAARKKRHKRSPEAEKKAAAQRITPEEALKKFVKALNEKQFGVAASLVALLDTKKATIRERPLILYVVKCDIPIPEKNTLIKSLIDKEADITDWHLLAEAIEQANPELIELFLIKRASPNPDTTIGSVLSRAQDKLRRAKSELEYIQEDLKDPKSPYYADAQTAKPGIEKMVRNAQAVVDILIKAGAHLTAEEKERNRVQKARDLQSDQKEAARKQWTEYKPEK
jgi:hypothetical protein